MMQEESLRLHSSQWFGIHKPLAQKPSRPTPPIGVPYRTTSQKASDQVEIAHGLTVEYLTREAGETSDQMILFPKDHPTHVIACVESERKIIAGENTSFPKYNPSVQITDLGTRKVRTLVRGMHECDGIRLLPWGHVLISEEALDGHAFEMKDPLDMPEATLVDRDRGEFRVTDSKPSVHIIRLDRLPQMAWEGIFVHTSGTIIGGDELAPGVLNPQAKGGSIYKFIPERPFDGTAKVTELNDSPLLKGRSFALRVNCQNGPEQAIKENFGQGCEEGTAIWIEVYPVHARTKAQEIGTGYYRPEDLHDDPTYRDPTHPQGARYCWSTTGKKEGRHWGAVFCAIDPNVPTSSAKVEVTRFITGDTEFNYLDNMDFQPKTGNLYVLEDDMHGEIYACLPDGEDRDLLTDGCVKILTVLDPSAEPTGLIFFPDGQQALLSIQHSRDDLMPRVDDYPTDDILWIKGFKIPQRP